MSSKLRDKPRKPTPRGATLNRAPSQPTTAPAKQPVSHWVSMGVGMLISAMLAGGVYYWSTHNKPQVQPQPLASPAQSTLAPQTTVPNVPPPKYEFYNLLQEQQNNAAPTNDEASHSTANNAPSSVAPSANTATTPASAPLIAPVTAPTSPKIITPPPPAPLSAPTPKAEPKPAEPPTAPARYVVQTGSFSSKEQAESARAQLLLSGQNARVESGTVNGRSIFRVVIGPFNSRQQADSAQRAAGAGIVQERR